jgi:hypothetical protein
MHEGQIHGFGAACALVQAVRASARPPAEPADFTERTMQTLARLEQALQTQSVVTSERLLSLLQIAAPAYAGFFEPVQRDQAGQQVPGDPLTALHGMRLERLPLYRGVIRVLPTPSAADAKAS